jgi:hypothetical protein
MEIVMNRDEIEGNWTEYKSHVKAQWGKVMRNAFASVLISDFPQCGNCLHKRLDSRIAA